MVVADRDVLIELPFSQGLLHMQIIPWLPAGYQNKGETDKESRVAAHLVHHHHHHHYNSPHQK